MMFSEAEGYVLAEPVQPPPPTGQTGWPGQTTPLGLVEDHVWFEDRWMVASLCDEWLITLCGLILG
jgi:hypothetical protein